MSALNQKTIKKKICFSGVGLHSGQTVRVSIKPSDPNTGIVFKRVDLKKNNLIIPNFSNVSNTSLNTTISNEFGVKVSTIEHLMGAFFGLGIDNALVEIDNEEVPILDGSAKKFIEKIVASGLNESNSPIKIIKINKNVEFREGGRMISISPSKLSLDIDFELKYKNPIIGNQRNKVIFSEINLRILRNPVRKIELSMNESSYRTGDVITFNALAKTASGKEITDVPIEFSFTGEANYGIGLPASGVVTPNGKFVAENILEN